MALSAAQITQVFEIFGVPQSGSGDVFGSIATVFGAEYESYDFSAVAGKIAARLNDLTATQIDRVAALLSRWDAISSTSIVQVSDCGGSRGTITDHPAERQALRDAISDITGIAIPQGGFMAEARRAAQGSACVVR